MATAMKRCKVCGCEYEYCHTAKRIAGVFRWQDVACSIEHGSIYLARIEASRAGQNAVSDVGITTVSPDYVIDLIDEDDEEELFDDDFYDDDFYDDEE